MDEYVAFMRTTGVKPTYSQIDAVDENGRWIGYTAPPAGDGGAINIEGVREYLDPGHSIVGVTTAVGVEFDKETFKTAINDTRVFAVPSVRTFILNDVRKNHPDVNVVMEQIQPSLLFTEMQDTQIAPARP